jgi:hypothetical protein
MFLSCFYVGGRQFAWVCGHSCVTVGREAAVGVSTAVTLDQISARMVQGALINLVRMRARLSQGTVFRSCLCNSDTWFGMKGAFRMLFYSKEYTFLVLSSM